MATMRIVTMGTSPTTGSPVLDEDGAGCRAGRPARRTGRRRAAVVARGRDGHRRGWSARRASERRRNTPRPSVSSSTSVWLPGAWRLASPCRHGVRQRRGATSATTHRTASPPAREARTPRPCRRKAEGHAPSLRLQVREPDGGDEERAPAAPGAGRGLGAGASRRARSGGTRRTPTQRQQREEHAATSPTPSPSSRAPGTMSFATSPAGTPPARSGNSRCTATPSAAPRRPRRRPSARACTA